MNSKHAPGRLSVYEYPVILADGKTAYAKISIVAPPKEQRYLYFSIGTVNLSAEVTGLFSSDVEEAEANARRLVACWNACEGVDDELLEDDCIRKTREDRDELLKQRDELLEALRAFLRAPSVGSAGPGSVTIAVQEFNLRAARAAISNATGAPK